MENRNKITRSLYLIGIFVMLVLNINAQDLTIGYNDQNGPPQYALDVEIALGETFEECDGKGGIRIVQIVSNNGNKQIYGDRFNSKIDRLSLPTQYFNEQDGYWGLFVVGEQRERRNLGIGCKAREEEDKHILFRDLFDNNGCIDSPPAQQIQLVDNDQVYVHILRYPVLGHILQPFPQSAYLSNRGYLSAELPETIHDRYYNWEYSIGFPNNFRPFPASVNHNNRLYLRGDQFLTDEDFGKVIYVKITSPCEGHNVSDVDSNIVSFEYLPYFPEIQNTQANILRCFDDTTTSVYVQFKDFEEGAKVNLSIVDPDHIIGTSSNGVPIYNVLKQFNGLTREDLDSSGRLRLEDVPLSPNGNYQVQMFVKEYYTDAPGHTATGTFTIPEPVVFQEDIEVYHTFCHGLESGAISIRANGGTASINPFNPYQYQYRYKENDANPWQDWNDSWQDFEYHGTHTLRWLAPGIYQIQVRDFNGCTAMEPDGITVTTHEVSIDDVAPIEVEIIEGNPITGNGLTNGSVVAKVTGGTPFDDKSYTYEWSGTDKNGNPIIINPNDITAGYNEDEKKYIISLQNLGAGTYAITVKDKNYEVVSGTLGQDQAIDCSATSIELTLEEPSQLVGQIIVEQEVSCYYQGDDDPDNLQSNGTLRVTTSGGIPETDVFNCGGHEYCFQWEHKQGNTWELFAENVDRITNIPPGDYRVIITDANGISITEERTLLNPEPLAITFEASILSCNTAAVITPTVRGGTPPYTYAWENGDTNASHSVTEEGTYTLTVTDAKGCILTQGSTISNPNDNLELEIAELINPACDASSDGVITIKVTGGVPPFSYSWSHGALMTNTDVRTNTINDLLEGTYAVTVTDVNGCEVIIEDIVIENSNTMVINTVDIVAPTCYQTLDGQITISVTGGLPPYTYQWSTGDTSDTVTELSAGNYIVYVTDAKGCTVESKIILEQVSDLVITPVMIEEPSCYNEQDGSISVEISGGNPPYSMVWNTGATALSLEELKKGTYTLTATDVSGCQVVYTVELKEPEKIVLDIENKRTLCQGQSLFSGLSLDPNDTNYSWTGPDAAPLDLDNPVATETGTYTLTYTDMGGCSASTAVDIEVLEEQINANFIITSHAYANEEVVLIDRSFPVPERKEWILPDEVSLVSETEEEVILNFQEEGAYVIHLKTYLGDCYTDFYKTVVVEPERALSRTDYMAGFIQDFRIYPNPSKGSFETAVTLKESSGITLKVVHMITGEVLSRKELDSKAQFLVDYNLSLPSGLYLMILETQEGAETRKIIFE